MDRPLTEWERDCLKFHGRVLHGEYAHCCPDMDGFPVDETTEEWRNACGCVRRWDRSMPTAGAP